MRKEQYVRKEKELIALGKHIRALRKKKKMTMLDLAAGANLEYSQISRIEKGEINTSISNIFLIAEALEISYSEILNFTYK